MPILRREEYAIAASEDVVTIRQVVRRHAVELGFNLVEQTKIVTAASELARNTLHHGGGGRVVIEWITDELQQKRRGLRLHFEDTGPGIADLQQALQDGFSTSGGLGLGLSGARRLSNEFSIDSRIGEGTRVVIARWR